jgi:hypothetical protein
MVDHLQFSNGSFKWTINFVGVAHDWELKLFFSFFDKLYSINLKQDDVYKLCWNPSKRGGV